MGISANIQLLCDNDGITINKLEQATGIGRGAIKRWENHDPAVSKVKAVANYFNVSIDYLVDNVQKGMSLGVAGFAQDEQYILVKYRDLSDQGKEYILQTIDMAALTYIKNNSFAKVEEKIG